LSPADRATRKDNASKHLAGYFSAPAFIVVLTDSQSMYPTYNHHDGPLAAGYLCLAARALGYGTVYVTDAIPEQATREVLAIPERHERVCITPLGIPDGWPDPMPKKKLRGVCRLRIVCVGVAAMVGSCSVAPEGRNTTGEHYSCVAIAITAKSEERSTAPK
jgi:hypothetical protein